MDKKIKLIYIFYFNFDKNINHIVETGPVSSNIYLSFSIEQFIKQYRIKK
jgi:hypothetical protein